MKNHESIEIEEISGRITRVTEFPCIIGSSTMAQIRLSDNSVGHVHAMLTMIGDTSWIVDLGSHFGTWLNGTLLSQAAMINRGDVIGLGSIRLKVAGQANRGETFNNPSPNTGDSCLSEADWLVTSGTSAIWITDDFKICGGGAEAIEWIIEFFGKHSPQLPEAMKEWLASNTCMRSNFKKVSGNQILRVAVCEMNTPQRLLIFSRLESAFIPNSILKLGFSKSEALVVPWLIRGRRNDEIATILGNAPRTVEKHIASIMLKLGVETRTAAAWNIIEKLGRHR